LCIHNPAVFAYVPVIALSFGRALSCFALQSVGEGDHVSPLFALLPLVDQREAGCFLTITCRPSSLLYIVSIAILSLHLYVSFHRAHCTTTHQPDTVITAITTSDFYNKEKVSAFLFDAHVSSRSNDATHPSSSRALLFTFSAASALQKQTRSGAACARESGLYQWQPLCNHVGFSEGRC